MILAAPVQDATRVHLWRAPLTPTEHRLAAAVEVARRRTAADLPARPAPGDPAGEPDVGGVELAGVAGRVDVGAARAAVDARLWSGGEELSVERDGEPVDADLHAAEELRELLGDGATVRIRGAERWCTPLAPLLRALVAGWTVATTAEVVVHGPAGPGSAAAAGAGGALLWLDLSTGACRLGAPPQELPVGGTGPQLLVRIELGAPGPTELLAELVARAAYDPLLRADLPVGPAPISSYAGALVEDPAELRARVLGLCGDGGTALEDGARARWAVGLRLPPGPAAPSVDAVAAAVPWVAGAGPAMFLDDRLARPQGAVAVWGTSGTLVALDAHGVEVVATALEVGALPMGGDGAETVGRLLRRLDLVIGG